MKSRSLVGLVALTVLLAGASWLLKAGDGVQSAAQITPPPGPLFPDLTQDAPAIAAIDLLAGEKSLSFAREGQGPGWHIAKANGEALGYAAKGEKINSLLFDIGQMTLLAAKTAAPGYYSRLEVEPPQDPGAKSRLLTLKAADQTVLATLILGKAGPDQGPNKKTLYVRRPDEARSWLASGDLALSATLSAWVETEILNIREERIQSVLYRPDQEGAFEIYRDVPGEKPFKLRTLPAGFTPKNDRVLESLAFGLEYLDFEEVKKINPEAQSANLAPAVRYTTFDGLQLDVMIWPQDGASWVIFRPKFDKQQAQKFQSHDSQKDQEQEEDVEKEDSAKHLSLEEAQHQAQNLQKNLQNWMYRLPSYKFERYTRQREDLLKPIEASTSPAALDPTAEPEQN